MINSSNNFSDQQANTEYWEYALCINQKFVCVSKKKVGQIYIYFLITL